MRHALACVAIYAALAPRLAAACSGCVIPEFAPQGPLPANAPGFPVRGASRLLRADGGEVASAVDGGTLTPLESLAQGDRLVLMTTSLCSGASVSANLVLGAPASLPAAAGTVTVTRGTAPLELPTSSGA